jgi:hypothetical protein
LICASDVNIFNPSGTRNAFNPTRRSFAYKTTANFSASEYIDKGLVEFLAFTSGAKSFIQFYPFLARGNINNYRVSFYKT